MCAPKYLEYLARSNCLPKFQHRSSIYRAVMWVCIYRRLCIICTLKFFRVFQGGDVKMLCSSPQKAHLWVIPRFWATAREHLSTGLTCRRWREKYIKVMMLYFTTLPRRPRWTDFFTEVDMGTYLPDVIIYSKFHISQWRGFNSVMGRISPFPIGKRDRR